MEYGRLKPLSSAPAPEPTAFTMKSIHEILAETGDEGLLQAAPQPVQQSTATEPAIQRPPAAAAMAALNAAAPQPNHPQQQPAASEAPTEHAVPRRPAMPSGLTNRPEKPGLGKRLTQRLFGRA